MNFSPPSAPKTALIALAASLLTLLLAAGMATYLGYLGPKTAPDPTHGHQHDEAAGPTLYTCGMHPWIISEEPGLCPICNMELTPIKDQGTTDPAASSERKIIYWRAPMDPTEIYDRPGKSKMGVDLVPVYEDEVIGGVEVRIDPVTQQNMGIRTQAVVKAPLARTVRTYGHVTYDETRTVQINPKFSGWIEKLHVNFTGQAVAQGEPLFDIYSPELLSAQEEYLDIYKNIGRRPNGAEGDLLASALRRLRYLDVPKDQIRAVEQSGQIKKTITIRSPFAGVVIVNRAQEGSAIKAGDLLYRIADLSRVWVEAHIYEYELPWIKLGQETEMTLPYLPGTVFHGQVSYIYPYMQEKTRDVVIRLEFANPEQQLKPDMYADVRIKTNPGPAGLIIPAEAVIRSGERNLVFVSRGDGKFTPRVVVLGLTLNDGMVQILTGLAAGEVVVTSGQFLLDSESKLKEAVQKMLEAKKGSTALPAKPTDDFFSDME